MFYNGRINGIVFISILLISLSLISLTADYDLNHEKVLVELLRTSGMIVKAFVSCVFYRTMVKFALADPSGPCIVDY